ncbi:putative glycoside hydrolase [Xylophilus phage Lumi]|nr:putative glycoside hydrolase [Xylophilus phage Lumi]
MTLTLKQFAAAAGATEAHVSPFLDPLNRGFVKFGITDKKEIAAVISTFSHESARFTTFEEGLYYRDATRIATIFKRLFDINKDGKITPDEVERAQTYVGNPSLMSTKLYDGYHGRGPGQITWRKNYEICGTLCNRPYVDQPGLLLNPEDGMMASLAFWKHCDMAQFAADPKATRKAWNGPAMLGLDDTTALYNNAIKVLG